MKRYEVILFMNAATNTKLWTKNKMVIRSAFGVYSCNNKLLHVYCINIVTISVIPCRLFLSQASSSKNIIYYFNVFLVIYYVSLSSTVFNVHLVVVKSVFNRFHC